MVNPANHRLPFALRDIRRINEREKNVKRNRTEVKYQSTIHYFYQRNKWLGNVEPE
jgi:hypothetical protein